MELITLTDEDVLNSRKRAIELGTLHKSFTRGRGNETGMQGEYAVATFVKAVAAEDTYDYDLVSPLGVKIEVKTKGTTRKDAPEPHYMATVATANTKQACDVYVFCRALKTRSDFLLGKVWVMGYMLREEFYSKAVFYKKGDMDPSNGYLVQQDCWNVPIGDLYQWSPRSEREIISACHNLTV